MRLHSIIETNSMLWYIWYISGWLMWVMSGLSIFLLGEFVKLKWDRDLFIPGIVGRILNYLTLVLIILMSSFLSAYSFHRANAKTPTLLSLFIVSLFILPLPVLASLVYYIPYLYKRRNILNFPRFCLWTFPPFFMYVGYPLGFDLLYNWISLLGR